MNEQLDERVREIVVETFDLDPGEIGPDASAQTLAAWTSLAHLRLMTNIEQAFGLRLTMDEMTTMTSVRAIESVLSVRDVHV